MSDTESTTSSSSTASSISYGGIDKYKGDFNHGDIVGGRYVLLKKIGYGTFSTVWLGYLLDIGVSTKYFAIKVQHQEDFEYAEEEIAFLMKMKSFEMENIKLWEVIKFYPLKSKSKHPSVCFVFDLMTCSMSNIIDMSRYEDGLSEDVVLSVTKQIASALKALLSHNYLHTDIRPENMLIKSNNDQMSKFMQLFDDLEYDKKWKTLCQQLCADNNLNLTKKKHKEKYNILKRKLSIKLIKDQVKELEELVEDIPRNVQITADTRVFLADFGTVLENEKKNTEFHIQSRNYKAPEVILKIPYTFKIDVWALGCCMCEFLTSSTFIDPSRTKQYSEDYNHIFWLVELFGQFPKEMALASKAEEKYFFRNGKFKLDYMEKDWSLEKALKADGAEPSTEMLSLLKKMLQLDPKLRPTFDQIIEEIDMIQSTKAMEKIDISNNTEA